MIYGEKTHQVQNQEDPRGVVATNNIYTTGTVIDERPETNFQKKKCFAQLQ